MGGDPINYSDPFGLCKDKSGKDVPCPDKEKVAQWVKENATEVSQGTCARQCRKGLEAGGLDTDGHPIDAGDYGPFLLERGAGVVPPGRASETGDIAVFAKNAAHPSGHIQVFDGSGWNSDFRQRGFNPYRNKDSAGASTIYRFPGTLPPIVVTP